MIRGLIRIYFLYRRIQKVKFSNEEIVHKPVVTINTSERNDTKDVTNQVDGCWKMLLSTNS